MSKPSVMEREKETLRTMTRIYCREKHGTLLGLCPACKTFVEYAEARLDRCPFQENKTTCARCSVHCYKPDQREQAREIMRFAGPRMPLRHPVMTFFHILQNWMVKRG